MYAVLMSGGKQYRVAEGDVIRVECLQAEKGASGTLDVLAISPEDGKVLTGEKLAQAKVEATVLGRGRGPKVTVFHYKRKKQYKKTRGHRQNYTELRIDRISV